MSAEIQRGFGPSVPVGAGGASGNVSSTLVVDTTQQGTTAVTTEEDLWNAYSLPANTLSANGKGVRITAWGTKAANANNVTPRLYFGGTQIAGAVFNSSGSRWRLSAIVIRTGASAQIVHAAQDWQLSGDSFTGSADTTSADTTAAIPIKVTGQNGTASANDMVFRGAIVEAIGN